MAKIMISLPDQMKKEVDRRAALVDSTRSEFIREALRHRLYVGKLNKQSSGEAVPQQEEDLEAQKKRLRAIAKRWRAMGNKYGLKNMSGLVIREREKLAKRIP